MGFRWTVVLVAWLAAAAPARAQCAAAGADVRLRAVSVPIAGERPLVVDVEADAVTARARGEEVALDVDAAVAFDGGAKALDLPLSLTREVRAAAGVLRLPAGPLAWTTPRLWDRGDRWNARLEAFGVTMTVALPCDALRVGDVAPDPRGASSPVVTSTPPRWLPTVSRLAVHASPFGPPRVQLRLERDAWLVLEERTRRGPWLRVQHWFPDGTELDGWVRREALRPTNAIVGSLGTIGHGGGGMCGTGYASDVFRGPAVVDAGTPVRVRPGGPAWGRARDASSVEVAYRRGDDWVAIERFEGLRVVEPFCGAVAWVPRERVELAVFRRDGWELRGRTPFSDEPPSVVRVTRAPHFTPLGLRAGDVVTGYSESELGELVTEPRSRSVLVRHGAARRERWILGPTASDPCDPVERWLDPPVELAPAARFTPDGIALEVEATR